MDFGNLRVSPTGDLIAVSEHPVLLDARGGVAIVDLQGKKTTLAEDLEDVGRVAWSPDGKEVWFSAAQGAGAADHSIFAVTLDGRLRKLVSGPGHFALQDVSPAGDLLVSHGLRRPAIVGRGPGATEDVELGWLDYSILADMSGDGRRVLFAEQSVGGGAGYAVYVRNTDGTPAVRLGKGDAHSLSHDGRWALAHDLTGHTLQLLPTGPGQPRSIPSHGIAAYPWSGFLPGDKSILFAGTDKAGVNRMYVQSLDGGTPRPVTPDDVTVMQNTVSPDGRWLVADDGEALRIFPLGEGESRLLPAAQPGDQPIRWSSDPNVVFVESVVGQAQHVHAIDIARGTRTPMMQLAVQDRVGASRIQRLLLSADGKSYAYLYTRTLQNLYVVKNVK